MIDYIREEYPDATQHELEALAEFAAKREEYFQRLPEPDGDCLDCFWCRTPVNQTYPVGPLRVMTGAPDEDYPPARVLQLGMHCPLGS
jgi:hypothetical protein